MLVSLFWMVLGGFAWAQAPDISSEQLAEGRKLHRLAAELYESGRYAEALAAFEETYALTGLPAILFNMANTQERLGDLEGAVNSLLRYLPDAPSNKVETIERRVTSLRERLETPSLPMPPEEPVPLVAPLSPSEVQTRLRPRWGLVAVGSALAAGFGTVAAISYLDGLDNRDQGNAEAYRQTLVLNNVALTAAGVGGGLVAIGFVAPRKYEVLVSASPTGAAVSFRW
ncbi:MAG: tetratricopeptide repeat protein [Myxococcota bacterium]